MAITFNDNLQINAPKPADAKYMNFTGGIAQPWASVAAANAGINAAYRYQYLTIFVLMNGDPIEFWYRTGTADGNLEPKTKESYTLNANGSITLTANYAYNRIVVLPINNLSNLTIGTTNGGTDIEPGIPVTVGVPYSLDYPFYYLSNTPIFFGGIASGTKILLYKTF